MPATIDLLIAQGSLSESDRPRCVHWTVVRARGTTSQEEVAKTMDAEEMLSKAGIRTVTMETCEAPIREMGELEAWLRDRWSDYPEHLKWLDQVVGDSTADHEAAVKPRPED
jgi:hypothetical protein